MATTLEFSTVPYPGLRPFRYDESDIFFGRETQTDQLLARLARNHFLAVTGPSGCGKSSLVKAGMIPALRAGFMVEGGSHWRICELRPGDRPLRTLAQAIASPDVLAANRADPDSAALIEAAIRRGPLGLIEIAKTAEALEGATLLVVIDQFEEIFRYDDRIAADEADAFVALLLASVRQSEAPIYVVITMRSDYLGDCARFHGLAEAVSDAQYLTPRLTREDLELAIAGPARVFGGQVEPRLLNRLINDFGTDPDQLPLLQHALSRLWSRCTTPSTPCVLTVEDYEAIGGLTDALSLHCDEAFAELTSEQQQIAELLFRRLSGARDDRQDVRAPARVSEIAKIAAVEPDNVIVVAEAFRRPDRSFLAAPEGPLDEITLLDLSHESLIRQWRRLAGWVKDEARSAEMYRRLRDWALRWKEGNAELWRGPDLASAATWREREAPNEAWAERYGDRQQFHVAMNFLDASEEAQRAAAAADEQKRQQQLKRVKRLAWGFGGATLTLAAVILSYWAAYVREHVNHYKEIVKVFGVPRGIGPLSTADIAHRGASYKFTTEGLLGRVKSVEQVNSAGRPGFGLSGLLAAAGLRPDGEFRLEYAYDSRDRVANEFALDGHGRRIRTTIYEPSDPGSKASRAAYVIGPNGSLAPEKGSCAAFVAYDYSSEGYVTKTHYYDRNGSPTPGTDGAFVKQTKHDKLGRVIESTSLWKDGQPMNDTDGTAGQRKFYNDQGNLVKTENIDAAGNPMEPKGWNYRVTMSYDDRGNLAETYFQDANESTGLIFGMCKVIRTKVDDRGNLVERYCVRRDGELSKTGFAIVRNEFDDDDQIVQSEYFDRDRHPVLGPDGSFRGTLSYDSNGNVTEYAAYGTDGKPIINSGGFHKKIRKFENGQEVRTEYRDVNGKLVPIESGAADIKGPAAISADIKGVAAVIKEYDAQGNETVTTYLGVDDRPVSNREEGYAIRTVSYDECGRATAAKFFDADNHPVRSKKGYAVIRQTYDEFNNVKEEAYLDEKDQPGRSVDGYARITREFDRNRNVTDERYLDGRGKPFLVKGAYAEHKSRYDDHNNLVEEVYLGPTGSPITNEKGWARHIRRYDEHNALVEEAWFGPDGKPVLNDEGWARMININDGHGRDLETAWFGTDGKPILLNKGYAKRIRRYDDNGLTTEEAYFETDGGSVASEDGYARIVKVRDARGRVVEWSHFGVQGEKVIGTKEDYHQARVVLDERNNRLEFAAFGPDGKPVLLKNGYSRRVRRYDVHDHLLEDAYYGIDGEPVVGDAGYSRATQIFDSRGKVIEVAFFGADGKPMITSGAAKIKWRYSDYGDVIEEAHFGTDGEPISGEAGYARLTRLVDRDGRILEEAYFGTDGKPVRDKKGYAKLTHHYDAQGGLLEDAYFGPDGEPAANEQGYSRKVYTKDSRGFDIETAYFGIDGEPILNDRGFARAKIINDDLGRDIEWSYFGIRDEPVIGNGAYAYHRTIQRLDARGNAIEVATFGLDGKPIEVVDPASGRRCSRLVRRFDANNKEIESQCFDASGRPVLDEKGAGLRQSISDR